MSVASILARLKNTARARGVDVQFIHARYGLERFLFRLSQSEYRDKFALKGVIWGFVRPVLE